MLPHERPGVVIKLDRGPQLPEILRPSPASVPAPRPGEPTVTCLPVLSLSVCSVCLHNTDPAGAGAGVAWSPAPETTTILAAPGPNHVPPPSRVTPYTPYY